MAILGRHFLSPAGAFHSVGLSLAGVEVDCVFVQTGQEYSFTIGPGAARATMELYSFLTCFV